MLISYGIIIYIFFSNERGRVLGVNGIFVVLGLMVGLLIGGIIVLVLSW